LLSGGLRDLVFEEGKGRRKGAMGMRWFASEEGGRRGYLSYAGVWLGHFADCFDGNGAFNMDGTLMTGGSIPENGWGLRFPSELTRRLFMLMLARIHGMQQIRVKFVVWRESWIAAACGNKDLFVLQPTSTTGIKAQPPVSGPSITRRRGPQHRDKYSTASS
jgi:hypothetical protein